jgi:transposase
MSKERISYTGRKVFVGIDVHRKTYSVVCICDGAVVQRCTMEASPNELLCFFGKFFPGAEIYTAYEAGFSGFVLHRYLEGNAIKNIVVHAASVEIAARDVVKTDKRDALKLATQLSDGRLRGIGVPSEELEARRLLTRTRQQLVRHRQRLMNQIRQKCHQFGLIDIKESGPMSYVKVARALKRTDIPELHQVCGSLTTRQFQALLNLP